MKFIWFNVHEDTGLSIAKRLQDEGNDVIVAHVDELDDNVSSIPEDPESKKRRLSLYKGMLDMRSVEEVLGMMKDIENKEDYFVMFDHNDMAHLAEKVVAMGFTNGLFPSAEDLELEKERNVAKEFVQKNYPNIKVAPVNEFQKIEDAISFLETTEDFWVLKGNEGKTIVPQGDNLDFNKAEIIDALKEYQKDYESKGFILEQRIQNVLEVTPEIIFYNGKPVVTTVDIENKPIGSGNIGHQTCCAQNLVVSTNLKDKINETAFPPIVYEMAKKHKGIFVWDASLLYQPEEDEFYFGEFCSNRFGYDSLFTEICMSGSATAFFMGLMVGRNPLNRSFGIAVRGWNDNLDGDIPKKFSAGIPVLWDNEWSEYIWLFDVMKEEKDGEERFVTTGTLSDLVTFTGSGDSVMEAVDLAYEAVEHFGFKNLYYRPKFDLISTDYPTAILNRLRQFNGTLYDVSE